MNRSERLLSVLLAVLSLILYFGGTASAVSLDLNVYRYDYELDNQDGQAILTKYRGSDKKVHVPARIDGHPVKALEGTFRENKQIESVTISDGIKVIGNNTFYMCQNLENVEIPDTVECLGDFAFYNTSIKTLYLPESVERIGRGCFQGCGELLCIAADSNDLFIDNLAFWDSALRYLLVPKGPHYQRDSFMQPCKFLVPNRSYSFYQFVFEHKLLAWLWISYDKQTIVGKALLSVAYAIVLLFLPLYLFYRLIVLIRGIFLDDHFSEFKKYRRKCGQCVDSSTGPSDYIFYHEPFNAWSRIIGIGMIILGVLLLSVFASLAALAAKPLYDHSLPMTVLVALAISLLFCLVIIVGILCCDIVRRWLRKAYLEHDGQMRVRIRKVRKEKRR